MNLTVQLTDPVDIARLRTLDKDIMWSDEASSAEGFFERAYNGTLGRWVYLFRDDLTAEIINIPITDRHRFELCAKLSKLKVSYHEYPPCFTIEGSDE